MKQKFSNYLKKMKITVIETMDNKIYRLPWDKFESINKAVLSDVKFIMLNSETTIRVSSITSVYRKTANPIEIKIVNNFISYKEEKWLTNQKSQHNHLN